MTTRYLDHDVQKETEGFQKINIRKVGVRKIKIPILVKQRDTDNPFNTIAHISAYCDLDKDKKGINMSRNSRILIKELSDTPIYLDNLSSITEKLAIAHETNNIYLKLWFEYLYSLDSPVTGISSYEPCIVCMQVDYYNDNCRIYLQVISNESSCCPCSKNMSLLKNNLSNNEVAKLADKLDLELYSKVIKAGYGAHNQRSEIDIKVELNKENGIMWIEDIVEIAKKSASSPTFNVLKREDERWVTIRQYENPKFVEDVARDAASLLNKELDKRINDYIVVVNNDESIHTSLIATAIIDADRELR